MKKKFVWIVQSVFRFRPFEKLLVFLNKKFPAAAWLRKLIPSNERYAPNDTRTCNRYGINYCLYLNDYQSWLLYFYNHADSSFDVLKYIKEGDTVIDIGGNIGQTAMMMAHKTGAAGKVISFEPFDQTHGIFMHNLSLNTNLRNIIVEKYALGSAYQQLRMQEECTTNSGGNRIVVNVESNKNLPVVNVISFDGYVMEHSLQKIDLIKIDVEGYEMQVLKGCANALTQFRPSLFIEIDDMNLKKQGNSADEMIHYLIEKGYEISDNSSGRNITSYEQMSSGSRDIYCVYKKF